MSVRLTGGSRRAIRMGSRKVLRAALVEQANRVIKLSASIAWPATTTEAVEQRQRREHELRVVQTELASTCDQLARLQREHSPTRLSLIALAMTSRRDAQRSLAALVVGRIAGAR